MYKIGIRANDLGVGTIEEVFHKARENGIKALQLPIEKTFIKEYDDYLDIRVSERINQVKGDVEIRVLSSYINPSCYDEKLRQKDLNEFKNHIIFASLVDAYMVGTETGSYNYDTSYHDWNNTEEAYQVFKQSLIELLSVAEEYNVNIGIEPVRSHVINSKERVRRILDEIDSPFLKIIFDPINILNEQNYQNQETVFKDCVNLFGKYIKAIHIKDFNFINNKFKKVPIGIGILNLNCVMNLFNDNYIMMESVQKDDIQRSISIIKDNMVKNEN